MFYCLNVNLIFDPVCLFRVRVLGVVRCTLQKEAYDVAETDCTSASISIKRVLQCVRMLVAAAVIKCIF